MKNIIWVVLLIMTSCLNKTKDNVDIIINKSTLSYSDSLKYIMLLSATIDFPELQEYYKVDNLNQKVELVILDNKTLNNKFHNGICALKKFDLPIRLMSDKEIQEMGIKSYLEYSEINIKNDTAFVYYFYNGQGLGIESTYIFKNNNWEILNSELWEY